MAKQRKVKYLSNRNLMEQIQLSKDQGEMTPELVKMCILLVDRYATKPNWSGYSFIQDMKQDALIIMLKNWHKFDPERTQNPFAFLTQIAYNAFLHRLNREKKVRTLRDKLLIDAGMMPSYTAQIEHEEQQRQAKEENEIEDKGVNRFD